MKKSYFLVIAMLGSLFGLGAEAALLPSVEPVISGSINDNVGVVNCQPSSSGIGGWFRRNLKAKHKKRTKFCSVKPISNPLYAQNPARMFLHANLLASLVVCFVNPLHFFVLGGAIPVVGVGFILMDIVLCVKDVLAPKTNDLNQCAIEENNIIDLVYKGKPARKALHCGLLSAGLFSRGILSLGRPFIHYGALSLSAVTGGLGVYYFVQDCILFQNLLDAPQKDFETKPDAFAEPNLAV